MNPFLLFVPVFAFFALVARAYAKKDKPAPAMGPSTEPTPKPTAKPAKVPAPKPDVAPSPPRQSSASAYVTRPEDIVPPAAWARVGNSLLSVEPLRDRKTGGYAHLTYRGALEAAKALGSDVSLPTRDDMIALSDAARAAGTELEPVTLPAGPDMASEAFVRTHDERVKAQLDALKWDGKTPTANIGKPWIAGAPAGRAFLMGWRKKDGSWIQSGLDAVTPGARGFHDDQHVDYAMIMIAKRPALAG